VYGGAIPQNEVNLFVLFYFFKCLEVEFQAFSCDGNLNFGICGAPWLGSIDRLVYDNSGSMLNSLCHPGPCIVAVLVKVVENYHRAASKDLCLQPLSIHSV
jgi:hypothetical protein